MKISGYSKIYNLGHKVLEKLFDGPVVIQEKVDGSQFSFCRLGDDVLFRSKGAVIESSAPPKMFAKAVNHILACKDKLPDGFIFRGEVLDRPKHNTLAYARVPLGNIVLYDIDFGMQDYADIRILREWSETLGVECVNEFFVGVVSSLDTLNKFMDTQSALGGCNIEGIVIKNYNRYDVDGKTLMGKLVSEDFKEKHQGDWSSRNPNTADIITTIGLSLKNEARWNKAVQHLTEQDLLFNTPKDIGILLKEINTDILQEESEAIKEALFKYAWPKISRIATSGFPQWYKDKLLGEQSFEGAVVADN